MPKFHICKKRKKKEKTDRNKIVFNILRETRQISELFTRGEQIHTTELVQTQAIDLAPPLFFFPNLTDEGFDTQRPPSASRSVPRA